MKEKAIAIVSGGMDSVTMLHCSSIRYDMELVLSFNYGSTHNDAEIPMAQWQSKKLGIPHKVVDMTFIAKEFTNSSALLNRDIEIPEGHYSDDKMKVTVVPNRNMIMLAIAAGFAEDREVSNVLIGSHLGDRAQYPDCREEFTKAASLASMLGTYNKVNVISPFNKKLKKDILEIGTVLGVDYKHTHTCYKGDPVKCMGSCSTCLERVEAFLQNHLADPVYSAKDWEIVVEKCTKILDEYEVGNG